MSGEGNGERKNPRHPGARRNLFLSRRYVTHAWTAGPAGCGRVRSGVGDGASNAPGDNRRAHARQGGQWICSLCGQGLPADLAQDARRRRHEERHARYGRNNIIAKPSQMSWRLARGE